MAASVDEPPATTERWRQRVDLRGAGKDDGGRPVVFGYAYVGVHPEAADVPRTRIGFTTSDDRARLVLWPSRDDEWPRPRASEIREAISLLRGFIRDKRLPLRILT